MFAAFPMGMHFKDRPFAADIIVVHINEERVFCGSYGSEEKVVPAGEVRPRARRILQWNEISVSQKVMANYNFDKPYERGFWYDCVVLEKVSRS